MSKIPTENYNNLPLTSTNFRTKHHAAASLRPATASASEQHRCRRAEERRALLRPDFDSHRTFHLPMHYLLPRRPTLEEKALYCAFL